MQSLTSVRLKLTTVTSMEIVPIPWVLIPVRADLGIPATEKLAMVRGKEPSQHSN